MGKETKEMMKAILTNTQLIMKHLNIDAGKNQVIKEEIKMLAKKGKKLKNPTKSKNSSKK